uniref:Viral coat n=1 Tax=Rabai virus TaxID=2970909 RepID=A0AA48P7Z8_9VIRU|nr:TPA_asm: putative viral coat [Rabai virus]
MAIIDEIDDTVAVRERKVTRQGVTIIRGGQSVSDSLFSAIYSSYANIVYHPIAMALLVTGIMLVVSEHHGTKGPLETILDFLKSKDDPKEPVFIRKIVSYLVTVFTHIVTYKDKYSALIFVAIAPIAKPSGRNYTTAVILSFFLVLTTYSLLEMLLLSQFFYLHVMLRNPGYKLLMVMACAAVLLVDSLFTTPPVAGPPGRAFSAQHTTPTTTAHPAHKGKN